MKWKFVRIVQQWSVRTVVAVETAVTALSKLQSVPVSHVFALSVGDHFRQDEILERSQLDLLKTLRMKEWHD